MLVKFLEWKYFCCFFYRSVSEAQFRRSASVVPKNIQELSLTKAPQKHCVWIKRQEIKFGKVCRATRLRHCSDSIVVLLSRQTKFTNYINCILRNCVPTGVRRRIVRGISKSWIWFDSGTTSESELFFCRVTVEHNCMHVRHVITSELVLSNAKTTT